MKENEKIALTEKQTGRGEPQTEQTEKTQEETQVKTMKEALADYVLAQLPKEMADSLYSGRPVGEVVSGWENSQLKKENRQLKQKLEKATAKPLTLTGQGGEREKDPFALGFIRAMNSY